MKFALPLLLLFTVACHAVKEEQPRNFADPAVSEALAEPMMSDVQLQAAASTNASESSGQPSGQPSTMQIPKGVIVDTRGAISLKQVAAARARDPNFSGCNPAIAISAQWSVRFPEWIEIPAGARLAEAAGSDTPTCALRIARLGVQGSPTQVLGKYSAQGRKAGFVIESGNTWMTAVRTRDGAAFHVDAVAGVNGTLIDLTSNRSVNQPGR